MIDIEERWSFIDLIDALEVLDLYEEVERMAHGTQGDPRSLRIPGR